MGKALIIGAGGVSNVVVHKCCQNPGVFEEICIASRSIGKSEAIKNKLTGGRTKITTAQIDANKSDMVIDLITKFGPDIVINVALPCQYLPIMNTCLATGVHYVDTANYKPPDMPKSEYKWQWEYRERFTNAGIIALLGSGFDRGVTGNFCAYVQKHYFDEINSIDIVDANAGDHGYPFATNFNPEINIREITAIGRYFENGIWIEIEPLSVKKVYDLPGIGPKNIYLLYHEELESLAININGLKRIRFWMAFSDGFLIYLHVLQNIGMASFEPIVFKQQQIIPLQFLKAILPDPASLGPRTKGKTNIGCIIQGIKDGKPKSYYAYNICDHQECYEEVGSQAISYTAGVPAMIGAMLILKGVWNKPGVFNVEEFDPDPFMEALNIYGLPWQEDFRHLLLIDKIRITVV